MARVSSRSKPDRVPSRSIEVSRISPAPCALDLDGERHRVDAGGPAAAMGEDLPPAGRHALGVDGHDDALAAEAVGGAGHHVGSATAAELKLTLSAPASSRARTSSGVRTPPPMVSGMKQCSAVRVARSYIVPRFSCVALMSRKQSSSAPAAS